MTEIILALDGLTERQALALAEETSGKVWGYKVTELLDLLGASIVRELKRFGKVMADPKLFDIPDTVDRRLRVYRDAEADLVTIHASGDRAMLKRAAETCEGSSTKILAITVLTSWDDADCIESYGMPVRPMVLRLANKCQVSNIGGVVCSVGETAEVKGSLGVGFVALNPGIRLDASNKHDQKRVFAPEDARKVNTDYIVVGRDIVQSHDRLKAIDEYARRLAS